MSWLLSVGNEFEWSTEAVDATLDAVCDVRSTPESTLAMRELRAEGGLPYGERGARGRCLPNVDHGECEPEARCLPFHAEGAAMSAVGGSSSFSFSSDAASWPPRVTDSSRERSPSVRSPDRLRGRGGLRAPPRVWVASREPSSAGRSSTILRSTSWGSERDGASAGTYVGDSGGGDGDAGRKPDWGTGADAVLCWLIVRMRRRDRMEGMARLDGHERSQLVLFPHTGSRITHLKRGVAGRSGHERRRVCSESAGNDTYIYLREARGKKCHQIRAIPASARAQEQPILGWEDSPAQMSCC